MTEYSSGYRLLEAPIATNDGSGMISHHMETIVYRDDGEPEVELHGYKVMPADQIKIVMDMDDDTGPQRNAKNQAYKELMEEYINAIPIPVAGWTKEEIELRAYNNDLSAEQAPRINDYIVNVLTEEYPIDFNL